MVSWLCRSSLGHFRGLSDGSPQSSRRQICGHFSGSTRALCRELLEGFLHNTEGSSQKLRKGALGSSGRELSAAPRVPSKLSLRDRAVFREIPQGSLRGELGQLSGSSLVERPAMARMRSKLRSTCGITLEYKSRNGLTSILGGKMLAGESLREGRNRPS